MKDFYFFQEKSLLVFKKLLASGTEQGKIKTNMVNFIKYMSDQFDKNLTLYKTTFSVDDIVLENIINPKYKFLVRGRDLRLYVTYLQELENRIGDFSKKEVNLRILVGIYFLHFVLTVKLVETYLGAVSTYNVTDPNNIKYTLKDIGIDIQILRYFTLIEDFRAKTIDDWLKITIEDIEDRYYMNALNRILIILGS